MMKFTKGKIALTAVALLAGLVLLLPSAAPRLHAADHAESTSVAGDPGADIADVFAFLDPNDNSRVILAMDVEGFVVPSELSNLSFFSPDVLYRFYIENTGDAAPDQTIDITFSPQTSRSQPQNATIKLPNGQTFTAPTTVQTLNDSPNAYTVTGDGNSGVQFFAGLTDDPFFFDIVGFNRFVGSVLAGSPDAKQLTRGRDSFAGYNIHMMALSIPATLLKGSSNIIGVSGATLRPNLTSRGVNGEIRATGNYIQIDRMGIPAVNTALVPFARKNEYNSATPVDDAAGKFANDIVATLKALGTNDKYIGILAGVAVAKGDYLRLDLSVANSGPSGGNNAGAGFPNGRRPGDDVIDTILTLVANGTPLGDNVNSNDVPLGNSFPYFAPPQQPRASGTVDDNTRN
jgi:Domain of unknown function (DUF4331)